MPDLPTIGGGPSQTGADSANSRGISLVANASANTKATSYTTLIAATDYRADWLLVVLNLNATAARFAVDIAVGASTAEVILVPDLYFEAQATNAFPGHAYLLPRRVEAGTRISARCQCTTGSGSLYASVTAISSPITAPPGLTRVEACGVSTSGATRLTAIDPGGTANTDSGWQVLIASTGFNYRWLNVAAGHGAGAMSVACNWLVDLAVGGAGSEQVLVSDLYFSSGIVIDHPTPGTLSFPCNVASGSRLAARARCSSNSATNRVIDIAAWGSG